MVCLTVTLYHFVFCSPLIYTFINMRNPNPPPHYVLPPPRGGQNSRPPPPNTYHKPLPTNFLLLFSRRSARRARWFVFGCSVPLYEGANKICGRKFCWGRFCIPPSPFMERVGVRRCIPASEKCALKSLRSEALNPIDSF